MRYFKSLILFLHEKDVHKPMLELHIYVFQMYSNLRMAHSRSENNLVKKKLQVFFNNKLAHLDGIVLMR